MAIPRSDKQLKRQARQGMNMERAACYLSGGRAPISLIAMTDTARLPDPESVLRRLPRGAALIWRVYEGDASTAHLRRLTALAHRRGVLLLIAGLPHLAARTGIMGVHLPEREVRRPRNGAYVIPRGGYLPGMALTAACHSEIAIRLAAQAGADAVLISPVFGTKSHPGAKPLGLLRFTRLARLATNLGLAPYALGGIVTGAHIRRLQGTGATGVAGIGFVPARRTI